MWWGSLVALVVLLGLVHAEHHDLTNGRVLVEPVLDLDGVDVLAPTDDQVGAATRQEQQTVFEAAKAYRAQSELRVIGFWPEPGVKWPASRFQKLDAELDRLARFVTCKTVIWDAPHPLHLA